jgi:GNAT superfamily N-acetyltransferase
VRAAPRRIHVRRTTPEDFDEIIALTRRVYPQSAPWRRDQLASHLTVFPEGQFLAYRGHPYEVVGFAASLIVRWDDYEAHASWQAFTASGMFTNHDPERGRTLYGAEVMVDPGAQRTGVGAQLYRARRDLAIRLSLLRIRAAARLRGYHRYAKVMSAEEYVESVVKGVIKGPTLSFQLREGFEVIEVVADYLKDDPESLGYAAIIEWLNPNVATPADRAGRNPRFARPA